MELLDDNVYKKVSIDLFTVAFDEEGKIKDEQHYRMFIIEMKEFFESMGFTAKTLSKDFVFLKGSFEQIIIKTNQLIGILKEMTINEIKLKNKKKPPENFEIEDINILHELKNYSFLEYYNELQETHFDLFQYIKVNGNYHNNPISPFADFNYHTPELPKEHKKLFDEEVKYIKEIKSKENKKG